MPPVFPAHAVTTKESSSPQSGTSSIHRQSGQLLTAQGQVHIPKIYAEDESWKRQFDMIWCPWTQVFPVPRHAPAVVVFSYSPERSGFFVLAAV